jgi:uncharacterized protein YecE (DUF72 family)
VTVLVGTSGWQYADWRGTVYPDGVPQRRWLECYAERFATAEVNNTFYRLPAEATFADWAARTPPDFVVAVKASRYLTHVKRLREPAEPVSRLLTRCAALGDKLGPVLLQLPPTMPIALGALGDALDAFSSFAESRGWRSGALRVAVELRHESWFTDQTRELLAAHDAAFCLADSPRRTQPAWRTAGWGYVRFHEGTGTPHPCYRPGALERWAEQIASLFAHGEDVYAYFNNDGRACAVRDAVRFAGAVKRAGLEPTRVPAPGDLATIGLAR